MDVIVMAGGQWQVPIISYLKKHGHKVHVVNPCTSVATDLSDFHIVEDIRNVAKIKDLLTFKPLFVTSDQSDIAVMPVALLSVMLGTNGNSPEAVVLFTNKLVMAKFATKIGIKVPLFAESGSKFNLPVVIKPVDANASRGFVYVDDYEDIDKSIMYSKSFSTTNTCMIQEYVTGEHVILDGICSNGKHRTLAHAIKDHFRKGVISSVVYSSDLDEKTVKNLYEMNDVYVELSGLRFGITHAEYIVGKSIWLIEIAARGGGYGISSDILPWVTGINLYNIFYNDLLGKSTDVKSLVLMRKPAAIRFFEYPTGVVNDISGVEDVLKLPLVNDFRLAITKGESISSAVNGGSRHAVAVILAERKEQIVETIKAIERIVKVVVHER